METPINGRDLLAMIDNQANIIIYRQLLEIDNLDDILGEHKAVIILYETKEQRGHWTLLFERDNETIEFFDPYGLFIDDEFNFIPSGFIAEHGLYPKMRELLYNSKYENIEYNDHQLQDLSKPKTATCGRWVVLRLIFRTVHIDEFVKAVKTIAKNMNLTKDETVYELTKHLLIN